MHVTPLAENGSKANSRANRDTGSPRWESLMVWHLTRVGWRMGVPLRAQLSVHSPTGDLPWNNAVTSSTLTACTSA